MKLDDSIPGTDYVHRKEQEAASPVVGDMNLVINAGLTKLEYAAIHIYAGMQPRIVENEACDGVSDSDWREFAISEARAILKACEEQQ